VLGEDHPDTLTSMSNLAVTRRALGDPESARQLHEQALAGRRRVLGEDHPDTLASVFHGGVVAVAWATVGWCGWRPGRSGVVVGGAVLAGGHLGRLVGTAAWPLSGWAGRRCCRAASAAQRQGPKPGERGGELGGPSPGALESQDDPAGMAYHPGGKLEQPVAQRLGFGHAKLARQQQRLRPAGQVLGGKDQLEPDGVAAP
jgi:hypothetical protein